MEEWHAPHPLHEEADGVLDRAVADLESEIGEISVAEEQDFDFGVADSVIVVVVVVVVVVVGLVSGEELVSADGTGVVGLEPCCDAEGADDVLAVARQGNFPLGCSGFG